MTPNYTRILTQHTLMTAQINDTTPWKRLEKHAEMVKQQTHLRTLLQDKERCAVLRAEHAGIMLDFSRENILPETMDMLFDLASVAGLEQKRARMVTGHHINSTEGRPVMHMALRAPREQIFTVDGCNVVPEVHAVLDQIAAFSKQVREGKWLGSTGKQLTSVVAIGIGGSFLGPEFVYEALRTDSVGSTAAEGRTLRFLANVDPVDVSRALEGLDAETTLCIVISKTFTTAETMLNARTVRHWLCNHIPSANSSDIVRQHMVAVSTAVQRALAFGIAEDNIFGFWNWVGGRYSVSSAVGALPLALHYGFPVVQQFLQGAHDMDKHFFESPLRSNLPVLMGLLGIWNSTFLGHSCRAILPYSQALVRFPAHVQQLDMESNGKRVSTEGVALPFDCGEIIFGEPGTNGQHSFYQLLHQGRVVPAEFIGFCCSPSPIQLEGEAVSNHDELMCNFFAQPDALAMGKTVAELQAEAVPAHLLPHKEFSGNRPSLSLLFPCFNAFTCGQLLALYENRVAVQGFVWDINSFDQWGVELGKVLANKVREELVQQRHMSPMSTSIKAMSSGAATTEPTDDARKTQPGAEDANAEEDSLASSFNSSTAFLLRAYLAHSQK